MSIVGAVKNGKGEMMHRVHRVHTENVFLASKCLNIRVRVGCGAKEKQKDV